MKLLQEVQIMTPGRGCPSSLRYDVARQSLGRGGKPLLLKTVCLTVLFLTMGGCGARHCMTDSQPASRPVRTLTVAAVSCESRIRDVGFNLSRIEHWARQAAAAGADLALFPETAISGWWSSREIRKYAEPIDGPAITRLKKLAGELGIILAVGMTERDGDKAHITHVVFDGNGVLGTHRKTSLAPGEEKSWDPGNDANVFEINGIRVGIAICFESVHPPTCARLKANGAEIILAPYANGTDPNELLIGKRPYTYARARENSVWYVACDAPPHDEKRNLKPGAAYIIDPQGTLVAITPPDATGEVMVVRTIQLGN